ncbi:hypothetical protein ES703_121154 [subsurface metagenome]
MYPIIYFGVKWLKKLVVDIFRDESRFLSSKVCSSYKNYANFILDSLTNHLEIGKSNFTLSVKDLVDKISSCKQRNIPFFNISNTFRML